MKTYACILKREKKQKERIALNATQNTTRRNGIDGVHRQDKMKVKNGNGKNSDWLTNWETKREGKC